MDRTPDSRLMLALELLRSALQQVEGGARQGADPEQLPFIPPLPITVEEMSATDLLSWWFRPTAHVANPWDDYFDQARLAVTVPMDPSLSGPPQAAPMRPPPRTRPAPPAAEPTSPWIDLEVLVAPPEEQLADEQAEAAVECLYEFIHAIGRRDVDAAMRCVADDYHVLDEDREIDRLGLRQEIESLLDSLRGWEFEISLAEIPVPMFHYQGILIYVEAQIEASQPQDDLHRSLISRRIAVLEQRDPQSLDWVISAMSPAPTSY